MSELQTIRANGEMVLLPRARYEELLAQAETGRDIAEAKAARMDIENGGELLAEAFVEKLLSTDCPLREWRRYRGYSQLQLAKKSGIRQSTISGIEQGKSPRLDTARAIADALDCDIDDLF